MGAALFSNLLISMLYVFRQAVLLLFFRSDLTQKTGYHTRFASMAFIYCVVCICRRFSPSVSNYYSLEPAFSLYSSPFRT